MTKGAESEQAKERELEKEGPKVFAVEGHVARGTNVGPPVA